MLIEFCLLENFFDVTKCFSVIFSPINPIAKLKITAAAREPIVLTLHLKKFKENKQKTDKE